MMNIVTIVACNQKVSYNMIMTLSYGENNYFTVTQIVAEIDYLQTLDTYNIDRILQIKRTPYKVWFDEAKVKTLLLTI